MRTTKRISRMLVIVFVFVTLFSSFIGGSIVNAATNLVANGSFTGGLTSWIATGDTLLSEGVDDSASVSIAATKVLEQWVTTSLEINTQYVLTFYQRGPGTLSAYAITYSPGSAWIGPSSNSPYSMSTYWQQKKLFFKTTATTTSVKLSFGAATSNVDIDCVTLYKLSDYVAGNVVDYVPVDNVGPEILTNGGFESSTTVPAPGWTSTGFIVSAGKGLGGSNALEVNSSVSGDWPVLNSSIFNVQPYVGRTLRISYYLKVDYWNPAQGRINASNFMYATTVDGSGTYTNFQANNNYIEAPVHMDNIGNTWVKIFKNVTIPVGATFGKLYVQPTGTGVSGSKVFSTVIYDNFSVVEILGAPTPTPTPTPAPTPPPTPEGMTPEPTPTPTPTPEPTPTPTPSPIPTPLPSLLLLSDDYTLVSGLSLIHI